MIATDTLDQIVAKLGEVGLSEAAIAALRTGWPGVHFTCCSEDDIPGRLKPAAVGCGFAVYLVSGAEHCVAFTDHLEAATGLVLAADSEE